MKIAPNCTGVAEPFIMPHLETFLKFTCSNGNRHPQVYTVTSYDGMLLEMGRSLEQILATLREMEPELSFESTGRSTSNTCWESGGTGNSRLCMEKLPRMFGQTQRVSSRSVGLAS